MSGSNRFFAFLCTPRGDSQEKIHNKVKYKPRAGSVCTRDDPVRIPVEVQFFQLRISGLTLTRKLHKTN